MKTLDVRLSTLVGYDKNNDVSDELIFIEAKLAKLRQNFDYDYVFDTFN